MTTKYKVPKVRFRGFSEEWEEKILDEISSAIFDGTHQTPRYTDSGIPFFSVENLISKSKNKYISNEDYIEATKKNKPEKNDILITRIGNIGFSKVVTWDYDFSIYVTLAVIKQSKIFDSFYLNHYMQSAKYQAEIISKSLLSAVPCKINMNELRNTNIILPKNLTEQTKIGNYFQQLDKLIEQKEKKYQKLKQFKKAMLDKMFPKNGADTPEIRFKGFSGKWEEKFLEEIVDRYDNLRIPISASNRIAGDTPYYGANGIQDYVQGFTHDGEFILVAEDGANDLKNYPVQYVNGKIWVNNHAHVLQAKKDIADNKFLKYAISKINIEPFLVGGGRAKLNANIMMKINIYVPSDLKEQQKIGNYFQKLDSQIELLQKELEKLKHIKKASLSKMFV